MLIWNNEEGNLPLVSRHKPENFLRTIYDTVSSSLFRVNKNFIEIPCLRFSGITLEVGGVQRQNRYKINDFFTHLTSLLENSLFVRQTELFELGYLNKI